MTDLKLQHILTLTYLLSKGARHNYVHITTTSLGNNIKKSQQAASKHLVELENDGFIQRILNGRKTSVKITSKGYSQLVKLSDHLKNTLESFPSFVQLQGTLVSGMGEGAYYMSLKGYTKQFKTKIGYVPFPGTLNIKLEKKEHIEALHHFDSFDGILIKGFSDEKRSYGWVKCFYGKLNKKVDCNLIRLERTHHDPSIIEVISKINIRKKGKLSNGSKITLDIPINSS